VAALAFGLPSGAGEASRSLAEVTKGLRALPADEKAAGQAIPETGRKLLADLKREVGLTILEVAPTRGKKEPEKIREDILKKLKSRDVVVGIEEKEPAGGFGRVTALEVAVSPQDEELLAVEASFSLPCGWTDTDFYLFRFTVRRGWTSILIQTVAEYGDISGAQGRFDFAMSNKSEEGSTLVVTAHVPPQCKAVNLPIRYNAYRVSQGALEAQALFSGITPEGSADGSFKLQAEEAGMALSYTAGAVSGKAPDGARETLHLRPRGTKLEITRSRSSS
jgi:hypothetical protein